MAVSFHPGPEWYKAFNELDPSTDRQCIYYTQKEERCGWSSDKNGEAIILHRLISTPPHKNTSLNLLDLLIRYILCCCCMYGRAKHRDRIGDRQELLPLAERWLDEIQGHGTAATYHTTNSTTPPSNAPNFRPNQPVFVISGTSPTPPTPVTNPSSKHSGLDAVESTIQSFESQTRYNLRLSNPNVSTDSASSLALIYQVPQSEFAPHVVSPSPGDNVSRKLLETLVDDDFKTGSLYIFDRNSSPDHVKIGYTKRSVADRIVEW